MCPNEYKLEIHLEKEETCVNYFLSKYLYFVFKGNEFIVSYNQGFDKDEQNSYSVLMGDSLEYIDWKDPFIDIFERFEKEFLEFKMIEK